MSETITQSEFQLICAEDELPVGKSRRVVIDGVTIALFHTRDGFFAIEDACSHQGGSLAFGQLDGCAVACPRHGALFDVRNGDTLSLPAVRGVRAFPVKVEAGRVFVGNKPLSEVKPALLKL